MTVYQTICSHTETMMELPTNQFKLFLHLDPLQRVLDDLSIRLANQMPEIKLVTHLKLATTLKTLDKLRFGPK